MNISILCANDSMELVFPVGTSKRIMEKEVRKLKRKLSKRYPGGTVYAHIHEVPVYEESEGGK